MTAYSDSLPRRQTDPAWLQDHFLSTGHDETTRSATFTFIKRNNRHYAVTCRHIMKAISNAEMVPNAKNPTLAIHLDKGVLNLSYFTAKGLAHGIRTPQADTEQEEMDVAIAPLDGSYWQLLTTRKNKTAIDLDNWREPDWSSVKYCLAAGYPDEHKANVVTGGKDMVANHFFAVVAESASTLGKSNTIITLQSDLGAPHGYYFSGMSGGPVYAVEGTQQREVEDDELFPVGIIFEGFPSSGREDAQASRNAAVTFLTDNDIFFRALTLTPEIFDGWLQKAV